MKLLQSIKTEIQLIRSRRMASGIAARAIIASGGGHKFWYGFAEKRQHEIEKLAKNVNGLLFEPQVEPPFKTMDIPVAGRDYGPGTVPLVLEFVRLVNQAEIVKNVQKNPENAERKKAEKIPSEDIDGTETIKYLGNCLKMAKRICSTETYSLGLHPAVYFYSSDDKYKVASFYGIVLLIIELENSNDFKRFIKVRAKLEDFLVHNDYLVQQIVREKRSASNAALHIRDFLLFLIDKFSKGKNSEQIIKSDIPKSLEFRYLITTQSIKKEYDRKISKSVKSEVFRRDVLPNLPKCKYCKGFLHKNAISFDHRRRKRSGGMGTPDNTQMMHPLCGNLKN